MATLLINECIIFNCQHTRGLHTVNSMQPASQLARASVGLAAAAQLTYTLMLYCCICL